MAPLRSYRLGWQSQNLARFLLYKFCFLSEPVQVADDIGIDFFCTLFESQPSGTNSSLMPKNSFAIQIKSESEPNKIDLTKHISLLKGLELPFLIGLVNRDRLSLAIFSGEFLCKFFAYKGQPHRLEAELCGRSHIQEPFGWLAETSTDGYTLQFPKIAEISTDTTDEQLQIAVKDIRETCSLTLNGISSIIKNEYIMRSAPPYTQYLFAGPASFENFEANLLERLAEAFYNIQYGYSMPEFKSRAEDRFQLYEGLYLKIVSHIGEQNLPKLLITTYNNAPATIIRH